ncbi:MAG: DUF4398 domain-containing protein [Desulfuromonadales bacterium]|nr:DUF4398 domain-containing protein [Desulfuromonadales bacterium]
MLSARTIFLPRILAIVATGLFLILPGCAKPPLQKLDAADYLLARAQTLEAQQHAPTEFESARQALDAARSALQNRQYQQAETSLDFSLEHARRAISLTEQAQATLAARQAEAERLAAEEQARQVAEEQARLARQAEERRRQEAAARKAVQPVQPPPAEPTLTYQVGDGENLWTISAHPRVYADGFLWPLLYQANRDQIKDPKQIYPGQILNIRRDLSEQEKAEARQKALESDIFPPPQP